MFKLVVLALLLIGATILLGILLLAASPSINSTISSATQNINTSDMTSKAISYFKISIVFLILLAPITIIFGALSFK